MTAGFVPFFFVERQEVNGVLIRSIRLDKDGGRRK